MRKITTILTILLLACSCNRALYKAVASGSPPKIHSANNPNSEQSSSYKEAVKSVDTFTSLTQEGKEIIYNRAIKDSLTGELMGIRELDAVVISSTTRNIAEREGAIELRFIIELPERFINRGWQTEITPFLESIPLKEQIALKKIILTGAEFRKSQQKGYSRYERYLQKIISPDTPYLEAFANLRELSIFLERHLPHSLALEEIEQDSLKTDLGVYESEIIEQYLKRRLIDRNENRKANRERLFTKLIMVPYSSCALLDSIVEKGEGSFEYHYSYQIASIKNLNRINLWLGGVTHNRYGVSLKIPLSDTVTYNITSISSLVQDIKRYKKEVVERASVEHFNSHISFRTGKYEIEPHLSNNYKELKHIEKRLKKIIELGDYKIDSVIITASSSPEGSYGINKKLSTQRGESIRAFLYHKIDSLLTLFAALHMDSTGESQTKTTSSLKKEEIKNKVVVENWELLNKLILSDTILGSIDFYNRSLSEKNLDKRELLLMRHPTEYNYIKEHLYPSLRFVSIEIALSRKGMIKDTIQTTLPDHQYSRGLALLKEREYSKALSMLYQYNDINTAIAHLSLGHEHSALKILQQLDSCAVQQYLMAIVWSRLGEEQRAAHHFLESRELDRGMAYRGALDPEISSIIDKYNLNRDLFQ